MTESSMMALAAYRHLLRATRIAFKGDNRVLISARRQARSDFYKNRSLLPSSSEASEKIAHAEDVARFLRQNVVQGQKVGDCEREKYQLRIHDETERGDNDSIKTAGKSSRGTSVGCCS